MNVSIITPCYNSSRFIRGAIESVLHQTAGRVEHIVCDGGSTDGTVDILREYTHLKWISEADRGMYDAINKGIRLATGDIIAYLNSDDRYLPNAVETVLESFGKYPKSEFVYGYCEFINLEEESLYVIKPLSYFWAKYSLRILWIQPAWFWRREIHNRIGYFDESLKGASDADFMRRLVVGGFQGRLVRKPLAKFMLRDDSLAVQLGGPDGLETRRCREAYGADRWTPGRIAAESFFILKNLGTYAQRLTYRRNVRKINARV